MSILLEQFQRCGFIAEKRSTPNNYMFIRYYDMLQAQKALALNGTCINGNYIGVVQCSYEEVIDGFEDNLNKARTTPMDTRYYFHLLSIMDRSYVVKENEIYKLAPVKAFSLCT